MAELARAIGGERRSVTKGKKELGASVTAVGVHHIGKDTMDMVSEDHSTDRDGSARNYDMKKAKKNMNKTSIDEMKEAAAKYGVQVTDMSERGVRAIGILGGVRRQDREPNKNEPTNPAADDDLDN